MNGNIEEENGTVSEIINSSGKKRTVIRSQIIRSSHNMQACKCDDFAGSTNDFEIDAVTSLSTTVWCAMGWTKCPLTYTRPACPLLHDQSPIYIHRTQHPGSTLFSFDFNNSFYALIIDESREFSSCATLTPVHLQHRPQQLNICPSSEKGHIFNQTPRQWCQCVPQFQKLFNHAQVLAPEDHLSWQIHGQWPLGNVIRYGGSNRSRRHCRAMNSGWIHEHYCSSSAC